MLPFGSINEMFTSSLKKKKEKKKEKQEIGPKEPTKRLNGIGFSNYTSKLELGHQ
jgi:hypothetical protein